MKNFFCLLKSYKQTLRRNDLKPRFQLVLFIFHHFAFVVTWSIKEHTPYTTTAVASTFMYVFPDHQLPKGTRDSRPDPSACVSAVPVGAVDLFFSSCEWLYRGRLDFTVIFYFWTTRPSHWPVQWLEQTVWRNTHSSLMKQRLMTVLLLEKNTLISTFSLHWTFFYCFYSLFIFQYCGWERLLRTGERAFWTGVVHTFCFFLKYFLLLRERWMQPLLDIT